MRLRRSPAADGAPPLRIVGGGGQPSADDPAPLTLTWGTLSDLWVHLHLNPSDDTQELRRRVDTCFAERFGNSPTLGDIMGMYDREPNFEDEFKPGDRMVLMGMEYVGSISTRFGPAEKVLITVITRDSYPNRQTYSAIGVGFAAMARRATEADFPHVAEYVVVAMASGNTVKRFAKCDISPADWNAGDDGPPVVIEETSTAGPGVSTESPGF